MFETATLVQTGKVRDFPLILMGVDYWRPLHDALASTLLAHEAIAVEDAVGCIRECARRRFGIDVSRNVVRRRSL